MLAAFAAALLMVITPGPATMAQSESRMPMIGEYAPYFTATTTHGDIEFPNQFLGKWVILFSHPSAFTPVCTSEFMEMQKMISEFKELKCELIGLSTDGLDAQYEWIRTIHDDVEFMGMKDVEITFPIIADNDMKVAKRYGMVHPQISTEKTVRAVFFIDPQGMIRAMLYYPISNGRNTHELIRLLKAIQVTDEYDVATPSDWQPGEDVFTPPPYVSKEASREYAEAWENMNCPVWFMCLKSLPHNPVER